MRSEARHSKKGTGEKKEGNPQARNEKYISHLFGYLVMPLVSLQRLQPKKLLLRQTVVFSLKRRRRISSFVKVVFSLGSSLTPILLLSFSVCFYYIFNVCFPFCISERVT